MGENDLRLAKLIKLATDDGMFECADHVKIGTRYLVDMDTKKKLVFFNNKHRATHMKEMIDTVENGAHYSSLPTEMLDIEKGD